MLLSYRELHELCFYFAVNEKCVMKYRRVFIMHHIVYVVFLSYSFTTVTEVR